MQALWVGLDIGEVESGLCVLDDSGDPIHEQIYLSDAAEIDAVLKQFPRASIKLVAVEAGPGAHLIRGIRDYGYPVAIFETRTASHFLKIRRNKTDRGDARGLADLARLGRNSVSEVKLKSRECQLLRSRLIIRHKLVRHGQAVRGAIRSLIRLHGGTWKGSKAAGGTRREANEQVGKIRAELGIDLTAELCPLVELSEALQTHLKETDQWLRKTAEDNAICRKLMDIPGVGPICALSFYTAIEDPHRFRRTADVGPYLGLTPLVRQSGNRMIRKGISKMGSRLTRAHLFGAATGLMLRCKDDIALKDWALALASRTGKNKAKVALARKLAIVMLTMWRSGTHFDPQLPRRLAQPAVKAAA